MLAAAITDSPACFGRFASSWKRIFEFCFFSWHHDNDGDVHSKQFIVATLNFGWRFCTSPRSSRRRRRLVPVNVLLHHHLSAEFRRLGHIHADLVSLGSLRIFACHTYSFSIHIACQWPHGECRNAVKNCHTATASIHNLFNIHFPSLSLPLSTTLAFARPLSATVRTI